MTDPHHTGHHTGPSEDDTAYGYTFADWLEAAGRTDSASEYDLRAAWRAGEDPAEYDGPLKDKP